MKIRLFKYKLKQLFCRHYWDFLNMEHQYVDALGNIVIVWKCKCKKCGKVKFIHKK